MRKQSVYASLIIQPHVAMRKQSRQVRMLGLHNQPINPITWHMNQCHAEVPAINNHNI
jgi:hypothetical protein